MGVRGGLCDAILALLGWMHGGNSRARIVQRPVIGVSAASGASLGCGLVFGAGAVVDGIEPGQRVVSQGAYLTRLSPAKAAAGGHAH